MTILTQSPLQEARPLSYFIGHLFEIPSWAWLYVAADTSEISLHTPCYAQAFDAREMTDAEMDAFEDHVAGAGVKRFLNSDQLQEIVENGRQQHPAPTPQQIIDAIAYYWTHDAFIELPPNAA
ncbi:hypothetical protein IB223_16170 [Pseudoxanthomonas sp. PXM03]|uniref:DUF7716 domain-containing protein n=1 Tax=Pseudoxanthomonas sp. PXM03 TaxID=2769284 RepID=UPI001786CA1C|nr:hypothetical protein [Pseudoxanthomonas sp. PXM03]MBD9437633.1 hypothetical protein [Pseudoxanthomonas sp. PXM03]